MAQILVLGGTAWLGRAVVRQALAQGHEVTCLARGDRPAPDGARLVAADRHDGTIEPYAALPDTSWDLVIDVARQPGQVRGALAALSDRAAHWVFVSSISVYADHSRPDADESAPLLPALIGDVAQAEEYGAGKVACEQAVIGARGPHALIARPGLIAGHGDPSDRFGYWPGRFALAAERAEPVLVPDRTDRACQWIDVRDLAAWLVTAGVGGTTGVMDAVGPATTLEAVLYAAIAAAGFSGRVVRAGDEALREAGVEEFMGPRSLPLWLSDPAWAGFLDRSGAAAAAAGLGHRPLTETVGDALAWERELGLGRPRAGAGLDRPDELALIAALTH
ncbi:MAG: NAD-dependent epimerase/dehydratase family protein [Micrococcales bacterium]|nr:NAD-dependent epimerase/dehydratase family protein [Micrococcales bacterium]